jgi:hypothetical protein
MRMRSQELGEAMLVAMAGVTLEVTKERLKVMEDMAVGKQAGTSPLINSKMIAIAEAVVATLTGEVVVLLILEDTAEAEDQATIKVAMAKSHPTLRRLQPMVATQLLIRLLPLISRLLTPISHPEVAGTKEAPLTSLTVELHNSNHKVEPLQTRFSLAILVSLSTRRLSRNFSNRTRSAL